MTERDVLTAEEVEALIRAANAAWDNGAITVGAMVEALVPTVDSIKVEARREAWDEGWLIGFSNCTGTAGGRTANPYRPDTWGHHMGDAPADAPAPLRGDA